MSYIVDFAQHLDIGDYRYYCLRGRKEKQYWVSWVERQLLKGDHPDPACQREIVPEEEIPAQLMTMFRLVKAGDMPAVA